MAAADTVSDVPPPEDYGVEVLCASWNPVVAAVAEPVVAHACREPLAAPAEVDADAFLEQFYRCQS
ncbi:MAG: hypothetical protein ACK4N4_01400 [Burkholderiales bacterium]